MASRPCHRCKRTQRRGRAVGREGDVERAEEREIALDDVRRRGRERLEADRALSLQGLRAGVDVVRLELDHLVGERVGFQAFGNAREDGVRDVHSRTAHARFKRGAGKAKRFGRTEYGRHVIRFRSGFKGCARPDWRSFARRVQEVSHGSKTARSCRSP